MKRLIYLPLLLLLAVPALLHADGGMWLMQQLASQVNAMKAKGLQLDATDIYNPDGPSIKDAVVMFDGGCSGVIVSDQGLVLTNHHCGYDKIQQLSTVQNNYLVDGFWAATMQQEIPAPGLEVEIVDRIEDVTKQINRLFVKNNITDPMQKLSLNYLSKLSQQIVKQPKDGYKYEIKPFYGGNVYYMYVKKVYRDIRYVASPPSSIGKFGADTDNWMWPRHAGDFSIFRIYSDAEGNPVEYNKNNKPYRPKKFIPISTQGVQKNDFVMIMGNPGTTYHYFTPSQVKAWGELDNNIRIEMRGIRQEVMLRHMLSDAQLNIMYAAKYASSQNGYKRAQGANWAIKYRNLEQVKANQQDRLLAWANQNNRIDVMRAAMNIEQALGDRYDLHRQRVYLLEGLLIPVECVRVPFLHDAQVDAWMKDPRSAETLDYIREGFDKFYNDDYSPMVDHDITKAVMTRYCKQIPEDQQPEAIAQGVKQFGSVEAYVDNMFKTSIFTDRQRFEQFIANPSPKQMMSDPVMLMSRSVRLKYLALSKQLKAFDAPIADAHKTFVKGYMDCYGTENLWPDANLTLRFTFGQVNGYNPRDNVSYGHQTTLVGVMEKEDPNNWEYVVPERLKEIYETKDYGEYAMPDGRMPINFAATTHTTGGNSGSPVFNAKGELVGLNFDRNWEGVGGDIEYLANYQRSIILDIRYLMLVTDKFAHCDRLVKEMLRQ